jgi:hypothetical protein
MKPERTLTLFLSSKGACALVARKYRGLGLEEAWKKLRWRRADKEWLVENVLGVKHSIDGECWCGMDRPDGKPHWPRDMKRRVFTEIRNWRRRA